MGNNRSQYIYGQLGDGASTSKTKFVQVISGFTVVVTAGGCHSMVLKEDGIMWATDENEHGQLGLGQGVSKTLFCRRYLVP